MRRAVSPLILVVSLLNASGTALPVDESKRPKSPPAAAVLAAVKGPVWIDRAGTGAPLAGQLGMRLLAGDTVRVEPASSATLYLPGGGIVRIPGGNRLEIPKGPAKPPAGASPVALMSTPSLEVLEAGLWVLNDPQGSVLLSAMRGEQKSWASAVGADVSLLSPRYETVTEARPTFLWSGGPQRAIVVVGSGEAILWRGEPTGAARLTYSDTAPALRPGEVYWWRVEPAEGGGPVTDRVPFRLAAEELARRSLRFEAEMRELGRTQDDPALADLFRCAFYLESGAWTRMLDAARRVQAADANAELATRAMSSARRQMRLDEEAFEALLRIQEGKAGEN